LQWERGKRGERRGDVVACLQLNKCQRGAAKSKQLLNALQRFNTKVPAPFKIAGWRLETGRLLCHALQYVMGRDERGFLGVMGRGRGA